MTEKRSPSEGSLSLTFKAQDLEVSAQLPSHLPQGLLMGLAKAMRFAFAGLFPNWFNRADVVVTQADIRRILLHGLEENVGDSAKFDALVGLLESTLQEQERKTRSRRLILHRSGQLLEKVDRDSKEQQASEIEDDFLEVFWRIADTISDQRMREVFAHVLTREIRSPKSFSASTLNLLSTLHPMLAEKFRILCSMTFLFRGLSFVIITVPDGRSLGASDKKGEQLTELGISREDLLDLRSEGLIRSLPEEEYPDLTGFLEAPLVELAGWNAEFALTPDAKLAAPSQGRMNVISLTRSGMELRPILELRPHPQYIASLCTLMESIGVTFRCWP